MGNLLSKVFNRRMRILMLGLDGAGKTTMLYKLKYPGFKNPTPTVGFNIETLEYKNVKFDVWDIGGQDAIRKLWRHYYTDTQGIIFVVDTANRDRIDKAKKELHRVLNDPNMPSNAILLVIANKVDLPDTMNMHEIQQNLHLPLIRNRRYYVQPASAIRGDGLLEGLRWLSKNREL